MYAILNIYFEDLSDFFSRYSCVAESTFTISFYHSIPFSRKSDS